MCCKCSSKTNKQIHSNPQPIFTKRNKLQTKFYLRARNIHENSKSLFVANIFYTDFAV